MTTSPPTTLPEKEKIGLLAVISIGVAAMIGGGIFPVLAESVKVAGSAVFISFIISGICVFVTSYSYAKLTMAYDTEGGTVSFVHLLIKKLFLSSSVNFLLLMAYTLMTAAYARSFGLYLQALFPNVNQTLLLYVGVVGSVILPILFDIISSKAVGIVETILVILQLAIFITLIVAGFRIFKPEYVAPRTWPAPLPIVAGGMLLFLSYVGFEFIANTKKDCKNPEKIIPKAFYISVIIVLVIYALLSFVTMGDISQNAFLQTHHLLALAGRTILGNFGFYIIMIAALLSMFSSNTSTIYAMVKMFNMMSIYDEAPKFFQIAYKEIHLLTLSIIAALCIGLACFGNMVSLINVVSSAFLLLYSIVNFSCLINAKELKSSRVVSAFATLVTLFAFAVLLRHIMHNHAQDIMPLIILVVLASLFGVGYQIYLRYKKPEPKS